MYKIIKVVAFILLCQAIGFLGVYFSFDSIPTWYATLIKPSFSPPNWVFAPVWTVLYALMGISLYKILEVKEKSKVKKALKFFWIQLGLNFAWTPVFFGAENPMGGLVIIIFLLIALFRTISEFFKLDTISAYLLVPYFVWVSFAAFLNFYVWFLNR